MENETLKKILKEKSVSFTAEELQLMIDEELEKSEEEMDTDLIDKCLDALDEIDEADAVVKKKRIKLRKALLIAAIVAIVLSIAIPVCAKILNINVSEEVVKRYNDYFDIDLTETTSSDNEVVDVVQALKIEGIDEVVLPMEILNNDYKKCDFEIKDFNEFSKTIAFSAIRPDIKCEVTIDSYSENFNFSVGQTKAHGDFECVKQIETSGLDILLFGEDDNLYIYYVSNNCEYDISLNCDFEDAERIAKTISVIQ